MSAPFGVVVLLLTLMKLVAIEQVLHSKLKLYALKIIKQKEKVIHRQGICE